jgi:hypothetical protein
MEHDMASKARKERQIVVRLPGELAERLEAYGAQLRDEQPGPKWTVSDVVRKLLAESLDEREAAKRPRR